MSVIGRAANVNAAAVGELYCVREKIEQDLLDLIAVDRRDSLGSAFFDVIRQAFLRQPRFHK